MQIEAHRLLAADQRPSPNNSAGIDQRYIVMHYTAGRGFQQSIDWLCNPKAKASAHFIVGRDGDLAQLVPLDRRAWHAGPSAWAGLTDINRFSIGIELDNPGVLQRTPQGWRTWFGLPWPAAHVVLAQHQAGGSERGWAAYTDEQIVRAYEVCETLIDAYPTIEDVIGHEDIAPGRKLDPGPAFPMSSFRVWLFGREGDEAPRV